MWIAEYAEAIRTSILITPHVFSHSLAYEDRPPMAGMIRGRILFSDGSQLHLREYVLLTDSIIRLKYAYHYVTETQALVFRYDNALDPAAKHLLTQPPILQPRRSVGFIAGTPPTKRAFCDA